MDVAHEGTAQRYCNLRGSKGVVFQLDVAHEGTAQRYCTTSLRNATVRLHATTRRYD